MSSGVGGEGQTERVGFERLAGGELDCPASAVSKQGLDSRFRSDVDWRECLFRGFGDCLFRGLCESLFGARCEFLCERLDQNFHAAVEREEQTITRAARAAPLGAGL